MAMIRYVAVISSLIVALIICSCAAKQKDILQAQESQVKLRSIQSRVYDTNDRKFLLRTIIATLQDLGFVIDDAEETLGTVTATKLKRYVCICQAQGRPANDCTLQCTV